MKCIKIKDVKELELSTMDDPENNDGSVIVKVLGCGICGSDIHNYLAGEPKGLVMGHEFCGEVVSSGKRTDLKVGDIVSALPISPCSECESCKSGNPQYCSNTWLDAIGLSLSNPGAFAEFTKVRSDMARLLPSNFTIIDACMIEPLAVSLHAVNMANIKVGEKVLITGGGVLGLLCAELAKLNGATKVVLIETNEKRGEKSKKFGFVDEYYNANSDDIHETLKELTSAGFDKIFECSGSEEAIVTGVEAARAGSTIILVGVPTTDIKLPLLKCVIKEIKLKGSIAYNEKEFDDTIKLIRDRVVDVAKYVDKTISLEEVNDTFKELSSGYSEEVKIIIEP